MKKRLPQFESKEAEAEFWDSADSTDYIDWSSAERVMLPNLKPSLKTISLRLPASMLEALKLLANKRDIPYQSLLKQFLAERIDQELKTAKATGTRPDKAAATP